MAVTPRAFGHAAPAVGFEVPLEMLSACHGRVEDQCATLRRLVSHVAAHGADLAARQAAAGVMRYFDIAAPHHHADEETDLFPALRAAGATESLMHLMDDLTADHRQLEQHWAGLHAALDALAAGQVPDASWAAEVERYAALYEAHIAREEADLLPAARQCLQADALDVVGRAMRQRRGVALPDESQPDSGQAPAGTATGR